MSKLGARRRRLARLRDARAASALRRHSLLALLAVAAVVFAAGCGKLTPGAGAAGDECPDQGQQEASAQDQQQAPAAGEAEVQAQDIAAQAEEIVGDATPLADGDQAAATDANAIAQAAEQITGEATEITDPAAADQQAGEQQAAEQQAAEQQGADQQRAERDSRVVANNADAIGDLAQRIIDRAERIAARSGDGAVDEQAAAIIARAQELLAQAEALAEQARGGNGGGATTTTVADDPVETTQTTQAPAEECEEPGGGEPTTTEGDGGEEPTTTTTGDGGGDPVETTIPPTTTLAPIETQSCDPAGIREHTGAQTRDGVDVCSQSIYGVLPGSGNIPQVVITEPANGATLPVGQTFTGAIRFANFVPGQFDDPATQYGIRPFSLAATPEGKQSLIGHSHLYIQRINGDQVPSEQLDSFLALNNASDDGATLSGTVPAVAEPGEYRMCADLSGGSHLPLGKGVAQTGPSSDCIRITFE
jgi:hypothetical protein